MRALMHICEDVRPANREQKRYEVYHPGVPAFCLVRESPGGICDELELEPRLEFGTANRGWIGDSPFVFLNVQKAMNTGWSPAHSIESSVRETVRWLLDNRWILDSRR